MTPAETAAEVERIYQSWIDGPLDDAPLHEVLGLTPEQVDAYLDHGVLPAGYEPPIHPSPLPTPPGEDGMSWLARGAVLILLALAGLCLLGLILGAAAAFDPADQTSHHRGGH